MKLRALIIFPVLIFMLAGFERPEPTLHGAWRMQVGSTDMIMNIQDGYLSHASFDKAGKKFHQTRGGSFQVKIKKLSCCMNSALLKRNRLEKQLNILTVLMTIIWSGSIMEFGKHGRESMIINNHSPGSGGFQAGCRMVK